jgi:hypothetical protein
MTRWSDEFTISISRENFDLHGSVYGLKDAPLHPIVLVILFMLRIRNLPTSFRCLDLFAGRIFLRLNSYSPQNKTWLNRTGQKRM